MSVMVSLRTTALLKTDIVGSTPRFRALLSSDLGMLLSEHQALVERCAATHGGRIFRSAGDGYWIEFASATGASRAAIAMQEEVRLSQINRGDDRLTLRAVIGLGDVAIQGDDFAGDVLALITRLEEITPGGEIYLTLAAQLALVASEIQTTLVGHFPLQGFSDTTPIYRIDARHRTRIFPNAKIMLTDVRGFWHFTQSDNIQQIERALSSLDAIIQRAAQEFGGTIRYGVGDSHVLTFPDLFQALSAAELVGREWDATRPRGLGSIVIALHQGPIMTFRSFLYGAGILDTHRALTCAVSDLSAEEGGVFVTSSVYDDPAVTPWRNRLQAIQTGSSTNLAACSGLYRLA